MLLRQIVAVLAAVSLVTGQNSTDDLEVRVTILEEDVSDLESDVVELRTDNTLQDERLNIMEETVTENGNDIDDLDTTVNEAEETIVLLQQSVATLEEMNNLLLERVGVLETALETANQQIYELLTTTSGLEGAVNITNEAVENLEADAQSMDTRLVRVEEEGAEHEIQITDLEQSDSDQSERMTIIENDVDEWDDRIVTLEVANNDVQERLAVLEEVITVPWVACASSPCGGGGTCIDVNVDTFICMCRDGYFGETCQNTPTEACSSSPCENGGTCHDVNVDTFICSCRDGYFGSTCEASYAETTFLASVTPDPGDPPNPIVFNVERINPGGHYDVTTGIYTVPLDGIYEFTVHIWTLHDASYYVLMEVDDVLVASGYASEGTYDDPYMDMSVIQSLTAGQEVWVSDNGLIGMQGDDSYGMNSWFSGHLIHAF